ASRLLVVDTQGGDQLEDGLHRRHLAAADALGSSLLELPLEITGPSHPTGHREALWRLVGEEKGEVQKRGQRQEPSRRALDGEDDHQHARGDRHLPEHGLRHRAGAWQNPAEERRGADARRDWGDKDGTANQGAQQWAPAPLMGRRAGVLGLVAWAGLRDGRLLALLLTRGSSAAGSRGVGLLDLPGQLARRGVPLGIGGEVSTASWHGRPRAVTRSAPISYVPFCGRSRSRAVWMGL